MHILYVKCVIHILWQLFLNKITWMKKNGWRRLRVVALSRKQKTKQHEFPVRCLWAARAQYNTYLCERCLVDFIFYLFIRDYAVHIYVSVGMYNYTKRIHMVENTKFFFLCPNQGFPFIVSSNFIKINSIASRSLFWNLFTSVKQRSCALTTNGFFS